MYSLPVPDQASVSPKATEGFLYLPSPNPNKTPIYVLQTSFGIITDASNWKEGMQQILDLDADIRDKKFYVIYLSTTEPDYAKNPNASSSVGHFYLYEYDPSKRGDDKFTEYSINGDGRCGLNAILKAQELTANKHNLLINHDKTGSASCYGVNYSQSDDDATSNPKKELFENWLKASNQDNSLINGSSSIFKDLSYCFYKFNELEIGTVIDFFKYASNSNLEYRDASKLIFTSTGLDKFKKFEEYSNRSDVNLLSENIEFLDFSETSQDFIYPHNRYYFPNNAYYAHIIDIVSKKFLDQIFAQEETLEDDKKQKIEAFCEKVEELIPHVLSGERKLSLEISVQKLKIAKAGCNRLITELLNFSKPYYEQQIFSQENKRFADLVEIPNQLLANPRGLTRKYGLDLDLDENSKTLTIAVIRDKPTGKKEEKKGVHGKVSEGDKITSINGITIADIIKKCQDKSINPRDEIARLFAMEESLDLVIDREGVQHTIKIGDDPGHKPPLNDKRMIDYSQSPNSKKKISSVARILPTPATSSDLTPSSTPTLLPKQAITRTDVAGIDPVRFGSDEIINKIQDFLKKKTKKNAGYKRELENFFKKNPGHCNDDQYKLEIVACSKMLKHIDSQFANMEKILEQEHNAIMLFAGDENTKRISFGNGLAVNQWQTNPLKPDSKDERNMGILNQLIHDYIIYKYKELENKTRFNDRIKVGTVGDGYTKKDFNMRFEPYSIKEGEEVYHVFGANVENSNLPEGQKLEGGGQADSVSGPREQTFKTISLITTPVKCTKDNVDDITKPDPVHENMTKSPHHSPLPSPRHSTTPLSPIGRRPTPTAGVPL